MARLQFVVGPLLDSSGRAARQIADRFALAVYPWIDADVFVDPDGERTAGLLAELHGVAWHVASKLIPRESFEIPHRAALEQALALPGEPWASGPYADPARAVLRDHATDTRWLLDWYDRIAGSLAVPNDDWVITHGEPSGPNLLIDAAGGLRFVDWDSVLLAPRERDLWDFSAGSRTRAAYSELTRVVLDPLRLRLYEAWYALAETAVYIAVFRSPHIGDESDRTSWENFLRFIPTTERWPEVISW